MKHLFLSLLILAGASAQAALTVKNAEGWLFEEVKEGSAIQKFTSGAQAVMVKDEKATAEATGSATVLIRRIKSVDERDLQDKAKAWRTALFGDKSKKFVFLKPDRATKHDGQWRYTAEFQYNTGAETMLQASALGLVVNGNLYLIIYEQHPNVYKKDISAVQDLLRKLNLEIKH